MTFAIMTQHRPCGAWGITSPVRSCGEQQETLFLLKRVLLDDIPKHFDGGMICMVATFISGRLLQIYKVVVWEAAYKEFKLFKPEER